MRAAHLVVFPAILLLSATTLGQQQPPVFRSGIDLTAYDFVAVDREGRPVKDLRPEDLALRVDGKERRIVSLEFLQLESMEAPRPPASLPEPYASNERPPSRTVLIAVDSEHLRAGEARNILDSLADFLNRLAPDDRAGVITLQSGGIVLELTTDHARASEAVRNLAGRGQVRPEEFRISLTESLAIQRGDRHVTQSVVKRVCTMPLDFACPDRVAHQAEGQVRQAESSARTTLEVLRNVIRNMAAVEGPKTVVLVSGGLLATPGNRRYFEEAGAAAGAARANLFVLQHYDVNVDMSESAAPLTPTEDVRTQADGLQELTDLSGGTYMRIAAGAQNAVERISRELSGYYLLTFEAAPGDKPGARRRIELATRREDVTLRARREFVPATGAARGAAGAAASAASLLDAPDAFRELPIRTGVFAQRGPDPRTVKLLVITETRGSLTPPISASFGVLTSDMKMGNRWKSELSSLGMPTVTAAAVPAGRYELRVAAVDAAGRRGTVTQAFNAELAYAGPFRVSDLILGEAAGGSFRPRLSLPAGAREVVGYLEIYGDSSDGTVTVTLERASEPDAPPSDSRPMALHTRPGDWRFADGSLPLAGVPPGDHVIRAVVRVNGVEAGRVVRTLRVEAP
jgi:VWFA-related protein